MKRFKMAMAMVLSVAMLATLPALTAKAEDGDDDTRARPHPYVAEICQC